MPKTSISTTARSLTWRLEGLRCVEGDDSAFVDDGHPLAQRIGLEHVVRREQDRLVLGLQIADHLAHLARPYRIQADRRLVEEEHLRVVQQRAGDVQALHHAARVALDLLLPAVGQAHELEQVRDALARDLGIDVVQAGEVAQVVLPGKAPVEPPLAAEDEADHAPDDPPLGPRPCPSHAPCPPSG